MSKTRKQLEIEKAEQLIERRRKVIEEQEEEIRKLEEIKRSLEEKGDRWIPEKGDNYFYVYANGDVYEAEHTDSSGDRKMIAVGNHFKTREEAEEEAEKLKVITELREYAFKPDWEDHDQKKWMIHYSHKHDNFTAAFHLFEEQPNSIYFRTEKDALDAVKSVGGLKVKKYLFGVKE